METIKYDRPIEIERPIEIKVGEKIIVLSPDEIDRNHNNDIGDSGSALITIRKTMASATRLMAQRILKKAYTFRMKILMSVYYCY